MRRLGELDPVKVCVTCSAVVVLLAAVAIVPAQTPS